MKVKLTDPVIVSAFVYNPANALFKQPANRKSDVETVTCTLMDCPLRAKGFCARNRMMGHSRCPYGTNNKELGFSKRARKFSEWILKQKETYKDIPFLCSPKDKLAFIGDYVYLPYAHMSMCEKIKILEHESLLSTGQGFLERKYWTLETVQTLIAFRPQALFGGTIKSYKEKVVPLFIMHLKEDDPDMYAALIQQSPELAKEIAYKGRKAYLKSLKAPLEWDAKVNNKYPVHWKWDGELLRTDSKWAYSSTWGGNIDATGVLIVVNPSDKAAVKIQEESWVDENTKFAD